MLLLLVTALPPFPGCLAAAPAPAGAAAVAGAADAAGGGACAGFAAAAAEGCWHGKWPDERSCRCWGNATTKGFKAWPTALRGMLRRGATGAEGRPRPFSTTLRLLVLQTLDVVLGPDIVVAP